MRCGAELTNYIVEEASNDPAERMKGRKKERKKGVHHVKGVSSRVKKALECVYVAEEKRSKEKTEKSWREEAALHSEAVSCNGCVT